MARSCKTKPSVPKPAAAGPGAPPPLPRRVRIHGQWFRVRLARNLQSTREDGTWGDSESLERLIRVSNKASPLTEERWRVLWHEFVHMVLAQAGVSELLGTKTEEAIVLALEHVWEDVLRLARARDRRQAGPAGGDKQKATPPVTE